MVYGLLSSQNTERLGASLPSQSVIISLDPQLMGIEQKNRQFVIVGGLEFCWGSPLEYFGQSFIMVLSSPILLDARMSTSNAWLYT